MDRYEVHLFLTDGQETKGLATDLKIRDSVEYLLIKTDDDKLQEIRVDLIRQLDVLTQPRRFSSHTFQTS